VPYGAELADRVRHTLSGTPNLTERKMFGGLTFMVRDHMACGVVHDELMVRVGAEGQEEALAQPDARPMDFTGKPMRGFVMVAAAGLATRDGLRAWVERGVRFVSTLPPKSARRRNAVTR